ncbi:hypothetical protein JB92DRAFT_2834730 [Gautieria morchelliformis]|nr:hypothetical protein JB92DRAFT_2834730 [Gautieria morchelliformis]
MGKRTSGGDACVRVERLSKRREGEEEGVPLMECRGRGVCQHGGGDGVEEKSDSGSSSCRMGGAAPPRVRLLRHLRCRGYGWHPRKGVGHEERRAPWGVPIVGHAVGVASRWNSAVKCDVPDIMSGASAALDARARSHAFLKLDEWKLSVQWDIAPVGVVGPRSEIMCGSCQVIALFDVESTEKIELMSSISADEDEADLELLQIKHFTFTHKRGPEYNRPTERRKQQNRQSMEASSAKLRVQKHHRDGGKLPRSQGRNARRVYSHQSRRSSDTTATWRRAANSSLKRRMSDMGETVVTRLTRNRIPAIDGWGAGTEGEEVRRLIREICSARVACDGEYGRGGRGVGVGRMGSTTTGGNACWRIGSDETSRRRAGWLIGFGNSTVDHIVPPVKNDSVLDVCIEGLSERQLKKIWGRVEHFKYQVSASPRASLQCSVDVSSIVLINSRGFVGPSSFADVKQPLMPSSWIPGWDAMVGECG